MELITYAIQPSGRLVEVSRSAAPTARALDPDIKHSHVDEYTAGIEHDLFRIQPLDPTTLACVSALLLGVALLVSVRPALRAARVDLVGIPRME